MTKKRVLSIVAAFLLSATTLPALAQQRPEQQQQMREQQMRQQQMQAQREGQMQQQQMRESQMRQQQRGGYGGAFMPQAPQIRDYERNRGGYGTSLPQASQVRGYGYYGYGSPQTYYDSPSPRCYTLPEWVWHGYYNGGWIWENVARCY